MDTDLPKTSGWKHERPFRLGDLEVLPASGELRSRKGVQRLRPLLMDILQRLAAEPGEVVRRETLLEDVWPRRMVNDEVLSRAIAELRTALGDDAREARYIETLPKLGYRLVAKVEPLALPEPAKGPGKSRTPWFIAAALVLGSVVAWQLVPRGPDLARLESRLAAARPFSSDPALELMPRFSPTGDRIAFALGEGGEARLVIQAIDGSSRQFVGGLEGYARLSPVFLPDGQRILYWKGGRGDCAIVEHDLASGAERTIVDCTRQPRSRFDVSRDGRWLVFSGASRPQFPYGLWLVDLPARGPAVALTTPEPGMGDDLFPRFSPDARRIAFYRGSESHRRPWLLTREDPKSARALGRVEGLSYGFAWLANDGPLLAAADWLGFRALVALDIASGEARLLGARGARFPDATPEGGIVYENAVYSAQLWPFDPATGNAAAAPLWRSTRYTSQAEYSPDGKRVVFASNRDGTDALYIGMVGGDAYRVAFGEAHRYMRPHWSLDGRQVYAVRATLEPSGASIQEAVRIPAEGGPAELLAPLGRAVNDVREGGDGRLYWAEVAEHAMRVLRAPMDSLVRAERVPVPLVSQYHLHSGYLAYTEPQLSRITLCRLDTMACEPLPEEVHPANAYHWILSARSLWLRRPVQGAAGLARLDLATRQVTGEWNFFPSGSGGSIAVSPDESQVLVTREEGPAVDLMLAR